MMALGHTAIAAVTVAAGVRDPVTAFAVNLILHPIVDILPHVDFDDWLPESKGLSRASALLIGLDIILSGLLTWWAWSTHGYCLAFWTAALGSFLPDALWAPGVSDWIEGKKWYQPWLKLHKWCHDLIGVNRDTRAWGIPAPVIVVSLCIWWLFATAQS